MRTTPHTVQADAHLEAAEAAIAGLGHAVGALRCAGSQRLVRLGISMTHFHVLTLLRHHDAMPMGRLADILDASVSSATGIIDRMEERGLVERVRVPDDRRVVLVRPTAAGLDLIDEAELVKSETMRLALGRLSVSQLERLEAAVGDLSGALGALFAESPEGRYQCSHEHASPRPPTAATPAAAPDPDRAPQRPA